MGSGHPPARCPQPVAFGPPTRAATAAGLVHGAWVLLSVCARRPAVWVAAAAAAAGVGGLAAAAPGGRALLLGAATALGGLAGAAAIGPAATPAWIGASLLWPALGILSGGLLTGQAAVAMAAGVGLATVAVLAIGLRPSTTEAPDSVSGALVGVGIVALATVGSGLMDGDDGGWALAVAGTVGSLLGGLVAMGRAWLEPLLEPAPWESQRRRQFPWPAASVLRQRLVLAAMLSSLVTMVVGLFLVPAAAGLVAVIGCAWLVALALPPACLGHGGSVDQRWRWLERCAVRPERPRGFGLEGAGQTASGMSGTGNHAGTAREPWSRAAGRRAWIATVQGMLVSFLRAILVPRGHATEGARPPWLAPGGAVTGLWGVAWHAAVIGWPACVAVALSAGAPTRLHGAVGVIGALAGMAIALMLATVWSRWPSRGGLEPGAGETGHAVGLTLAAWALVAALAWR